MPPSFPRRFRSAHPTLHAALAASGEAPQRVSWADIAHWMWPLGLERGQEWRLGLGLDPVPLAAVAAAEALPPAVPLLYGA
jgi:hypothetical protein